MRTRTISLPHLHELPASAGDGCDVGIELRAWIDARSRGPRPDQGRCFVPVSVNGPGLSARTRAYRVPRPQKLRPSYRLPAEPNDPLAT